jgi:hypothetical protein
MLLDGLIIREAILLNLVHLNLTSNYEEERRCSSVSRVTRLRAGRPGITFFFAATSRPNLRPTHPPTQWTSWALSTGVNWPGREDDHSSASSAEVENAWSYTSTNQYVFVAWDLVKYRDNFTFTLLGGGGGGEREKVGISKNTATYYKESQPKGNVDNYWSKQ